MNNIPKGLKAVLHRHERILEVYKHNDLLEVINLSGLEDEWAGIDINNVLYDLNLYNNGENEVLTIYETALDENDNIITMTNDFENIEFKIEQ